MSAIDSAEPMWPTPARLDCSRMTRRMWAGASVRVSIGSLMLSPPAQDDGAGRRGTWTARHQAELRVRDLAGRVAPHLPHALHHQIQAVDVRLGEVAPRGVAGEGAVRPGELPVLDEGTALAARAEAEVLEHHEHHAGEVLVELDHVHVGRLDTRHGPQPARAGRAAGGRAGGPPP